MTPLRYDLSLSSFVTIIASPYRFFRSNVSGSYTPRWNKIEFTA